MFYISEKGVYAYRTSLYPELPKTDTFGSDDYEYADDTTDYEGAESAPRGRPAVL